MIDLATQREMQTPRDILPGFYRQYQLGEDGGQSNSYVTIEITKKISLYFPNSNARRKAIFKHDVHHLVTGYKSTLIGETEIGAWEIASGCRQYWIAFLLDLSAVMTGMVINPIGVYRAFARGRRTKNLYDNALPDEQVMDMPVEEIKRKLLLDSYPAKKNGNMTDLFLFVLLILLGLVYSVFTLLATPLVLLYSLYVVLTRKKKLA